MYCRNYYYRPVPHPMMYAPYYPRAYPYPLYVAATADERAFAEIVRHVAHEESAIESKRQSLAYSSSFCKDAAFNAIAQGEDEDRRISAADIGAFINIDD
jgi:hypothetical protein